MCVCVCVWVWVWVWVWVCVVRAGLGSESSLSRWCHSRFHRDHQHEGMLLIFLFLFPSPSLSLSLSPSFPASLCAASPPPKTWSFHPCFTTHSTHVQTPSNFHLHLPQHLLGLLHVLFCSDDELLGRFCARHGQPMSGGATCSTAFVTWLPQTQKREILARTDTASYATSGWLVAMIRRERGACAVLHLVWGRCRQK